MLSLSKNRSKLRRLILSFQNKARDLSVCHKLNAYE
jgi:hypothetical protein